MTHRLVALALVALSLSAPAAASAQGSGAGTDEGSELETEARARFALGQLYYSQARFAEAAVEFEAAYATHPHPLLLHNIYLARRDLGDVAGAVDALTRYLAAATDLSASERRLLEGRLAAMQRQLDAMPREPIAVETPEDDPVVGGSTPLEGAEGIADPSLHPEPAPAHGDDGLMTGAIVSFSVAGAAALTMLITGPLALSERSNLASTCAPFCSDAQLDGARSLGIATDVTLGFTLAGAATGAVLAILSATGGGGGRETVSIAPSGSPEHVGVVLGGSF